MISKTSFNYLYSIYKYRSKNENQIVMSRDDFKKLMFNITTVDMGLQQIEYFLSLFKKEENKNEKE